MATETLTAPMAVIKRNGEAVAKIRSFNIQETIQRGSVQGLGELTRSEVPPTLITCTASFDFYLVTFRDSSIRDAIKREAFTLQEFVDNFLFADGIQIDIYKKVKGSTNPQGLIGSDLEVVATINDMFITGDGMNLSEGAIGGRTQSFEYLTPVLFKDIS